MGAIALGAALVAKGLTFPVYWNRALASELKGAACSEGRVSPGAVNALASLRTPRHELMQAGLSVALGALVLWGILLIFRDNNGRVTTPSERIHFLAIGWLVIGLSAVSQFASYELDLQRDDILWCGDSPAALIGLGLVYIVLAVVSSVAGVYALTKFRTLPARLWQWDQGDLGRSVIVTLLLGIAAAVVALVAVFGASTSAFLGTPAAIVALYLLESTRSALLAHDKGNDATK